MIFDGTHCSAEIALELKDTIKGLPEVPSLGVCMVGTNPVSARYVSLKKRIAEQIGVHIAVYRFQESIATEDLIQEISGTIQKHGGYIVQLPLPNHIDSTAVLNSIPQHKDVDMLSQQAMDLFYQNKTELLPPVVGAFAEIIKRYDIRIPNKKVVVVGYGKLVGKPAEHWFKKNGAKVVVVKRGDDLEESVRDADIVVLGAGVPFLLKAGMTKEGAVILDAGTSEDEGALRGDADPASAERASLFTPVPGGIGPMTVVILFKNLLELYARGE